MEIRTKVNIVGAEGRPFMGPGILRLLVRIDEYRSINKAAKEMRLSYVKALKMLNNLEDELGRRVLVRTRGGNEHGGTELTGFGLRYIAEYSRLEERLRGHADREFKKFQEKVEMRGADETK